MQMQIHQKSWKDNSRPRPDHPDNKLKEDFNLSNLILKLVFDEKIAQLIILIWFIQLWEELVLNLRFYN